MSKKKNDSQNKNNSNHSNNTNCKKNMNNNLTECHKDNCSCSKCHGMNDFEEKGE